jgi:hypothetical protein
MSLLSRLERNLGRYAIPDLSLYLIIGQVMILGFALLGQFDVGRIMLLPAAVQAGEFWRLGTFLLVPPVTTLTLTSALFLAFGWYLFYLMGSALEQHWGALRFNGFILLGWLLTVGAAFVTPALYATNAYMAATVFLAFAYLNPDFVMYIFFFLPVKIKWLALIHWLGYGFILIVGTWAERLMIFASTSNFLVFFARDLVRSVGSGQRRQAWQARNFTAANNEREPRHRCHLCNRTDLTHPQIDFRYCSKCAGDQCYCSDHIFTHLHVVGDPSVKK